MSDERPRRRMERLGDLLPGAARRLGLDEELRLARAMAAWDAAVAKVAPAAAGACRLVRVERAVLLIEADHTIVAQELRLRAPDLVAAFAAAPGGSPAGQLRVGVRHV